MTSKDKEFLFEKMPVKTAVIKQIIPAIVSQMIVLIYNLADTYFVGLLNEPSQTAAVTVVSSPFLMLTAISNLFAVGGASQIAHALGKKDYQKAKQISSISFWCGVFAAAAFSLIFWLVSEPILKVCGATEQTIDLAFGYAKWVIIFGGVATILNVLLANLVRAEGNAIIASIGVSLGGLINIILDPVFVLPDFLGLGAEGAGMATAIANACATLFLLAYILIKRKNSVLRVNVKALKFCKTHLGSITAVGLPSAVQYALTVVAVAALSKFVSGYATQAVAALGIVKKLDQLPLYFSIGVSNGLLPFLAYNNSTGDHERRKQAFAFGAIISLSFSVLCVILYEAFAPFFVGLFINDALTIQYGSKFLRIMVVAMPMMSLCYPMIIQFQAMGKVKESLVCSVLRKGVIDIPLLFLMNFLIPLYGCMLVQPIVDTVSLIVAFAFYKRINAENAK